MRLGRNMGEFGRRRRKRRRRETRIEMVWGMGGGRRHPCKFLPPLASISIAVTFQRIGREREREAQRTSSDWQMQHFMLAMPFATFIALLQVSV